MAVKHTYKWKGGHRTDMVTPTKAIRLKCMDCTNWHKTEVTNCVITDCPLFPFRRSIDFQDITDEQRESRKRAALQNLSGKNTVSGG